MAGCWRSICDERESMSSILHVKMGKEGWQQFVRMPLPNRLQCLCLQQPSPEDACAQPC